MLPIHEILPRLKDALPALRRVVIRAPTGSGKSTQVPQMLVDHGLCGPGCVAVLQPRRLAARMLARRVASERNCRLGEEVGYQVRFDNRSGSATRIRFETDGVLLRRMISDPALEGVSAIVFDEFHERHLYGDVMLGLATRLQQSSRPDLVLVVMSATLESRKLVDYLAPCELIESEGRRFPVRIEYLSKPFDPDKRPAWEEAAAQFERLAPSQPDGDFLVFMPGAYEIRKTVEAIRAAGAARDFDVLPLHGELPPAEQDAAVERRARRKVVVATNVAETSLTIDGIVAVIDSGLARRARFDPYRGINTLLVEKISRASADQRAGRAGRTRSGHCLRLWTEKEHHGRQAQELPEIQSVDLSEVILLLKARGVNDVAAFPWLDAPAEKALSRALTLLTDLGALDAGAGGITPLGRRLLAFPAHPRYARMLLAAEQYGCAQQAALIAALTSERGLLLRGLGKEARMRREQALGEEKESDLLLLMRAWEYARERDFDVPACDQAGIHARTARQVGRLFEQFASIAKETRQDCRAGAPARPGAVSAAVRKCILCGFPDHLARRISKGTLRYDVARRRRGTLDAETAIKDSDLIVASEIHEIENSRGEIDVRLSLVTAIEQDWLDELFPDDVLRKRSVFYDTEQKRVRARDGTWFRDVMLDAGRESEPGDEEAAAMLAKEVAEGRLTLKAWDHAVEQWIFRLNRLAVWCPELGLPPVTAEARLRILRQVCLGARSGRDIKERPVWPAVKSLLSGGQQALLDKHAPERVELPNGRNPKVTYHGADPPFISLRIQELYDVTQPATIAMGRIRVLVHILAPNHRPIQITDDLASFWKTGYPQAKKELHRRYPRHEWR